MAVNGISINFNFSTGQANGPTPAERADFKNSLQDKSPEELGKMMGDKNLDPWQKKEILNEMLARLLKELLDPQDKKEAQKNADNVMGKNGKINPEALGKLLEMMGLDHDTASLLAGAAAVLGGGGGGGDDGGDTGL